MKIGIALGGGAAKGLSHIGVFRSLEKLGVHPEIVAGTSMGALVGAFYAADKLDVLEEEVRRIKITDIPLLLSPSWSTTGLFSGKNALELIGEKLGYQLIEDLPKPFAAISVDMVTQSLVTFTSGPLAEAIRASISIPGVFTPVVKGNSLLVDGGLLEPLPVQATRDLGADTVIAINMFGFLDNEEITWGKKPKKFPAGIESALNYLKSFSEKLPLGKRIETTEEEGEGSPEFNTNLIDIMERTLSITQKQVTEYRLNEFPADVIISPRVGDISFLDFHRAEQIIPTGDAAVEEMIDQLEILGSPKI